MDVQAAGPDYRLAVRGEAGAWRWALLQGETVAMRGQALDIESAVRAADLAAAAHAAFARIGRRRF